MCCIFSHSPCTVLDLYAVHVWFTFYGLIDFARKLPQTLDLIPRRLNILARQKERNELGGGTKLKGLASFSKEENRKKRGRGEVNFRYKWKELISREMKTEEETYSMTNNIIRKSYLTNIKISRRTGETFINFFKEVSTSVHRLFVNFSSYLDDVDFLLSIYF